MTDDPDDLPDDDWDNRRLAKADMVELHLELCRRAITAGVAHQDQERAERRARGNL